MFRNDKELSGVAIQPSLVNTGEEGLLRFVCNDVAVKTQPFVNDLGAAHKSILNLILRLTEIQRLWKFAVGNPTRKVPCGVRRPKAAEWRSCQ